MKRGASPNDYIYIDFKFESLAINCYQKGDIATTKLLIEHGLQAANTPYYGTASLLGSAIQANDIEFVKYLLDRNTPHSAVRRMTYMS